MDLDTVCEAGNDDSTQGLAGVNDDIPLGVMNILDYNQDNDDCSLPTLSGIDLSLTTEPYEELENNLFFNQNYLKHFFQVPPKYTDFLMPKIKLRDTCFC